MAEISRWCRIFYTLIISFTENLIIINPASFSASYSRRLKIGWRTWSKPPDSPFWCQRRASDWPGQLQDVQQQLLVLLVLLRSARVQLEWRLLEERQSFGQRPQLYQVQEVEVAQPLGPLAGRQLRIETLPELWHVVTPLLLKPAVWGWLTEREGTLSLTLKQPAADACFGRRNRKNFVSEKIPILEKNGANKWPKDMSHHPTGIWRWGVCWCWRGGLRWAGRRPSSPHTDLREAQPERAVRTPHTHKHSTTVSAFFRRESSYLPASCRRSSLQLIKQTSVKGIKLTAQMVRDDATDHLPSLPELLWNELGISGRLTVYGLWGGGGEWR